MQEPSKFKWLVQFMALLTMQTYDFRLEMFSETWMAEALYQQFKWAFVSRWNEDEFLVVIDITDFLIDNSNYIQRAKENRFEDFW